jgi:hypothetical protein
LYIYCKNNNMFNFERNTNPLVSMQIGYLYHKRDFSSRHELIEFVFDNIFLIIGKKKLPKNFIREKEENVYVMALEYFHDINSYSSNYLSVNGHKIHIFLCELGGELKDRDRCLIK